MAYSPEAIKEAQWQLFAHGCLSSVIPGAGQYFRGLTRRGAIWLGVFLVFLICILVLDPWRTPDGRMPAYIAGAVILAAAGIDAAFASTEEDVRPSIWGIAIFILMAFITSWSLNPVVWGLGGYRMYSLSVDMDPTIHSLDKTVADLHAYRRSAPQRGDLVVTSERRFGFNHVASLKRVIAVPGDTIEGRNGQIILNNVPIRESYIPDGSVNIDVSASTDETLRKRYTFGPVHLGPDDFFVMGDNRGISIDSRLRGSVKRNTILGKALYIASSTDDTRDGKRLD